MYNRDNNYNHDSGSGTVSRNGFMIKLIQLFITVLFFVMVGGMIYIQWDYLTRDWGKPVVTPVVITNDSFLIPLV